MAFSHLGRALDVEWFLKRDHARPIEDLEREDRRLTSSATTLGGAFESWLQGRRAAAQYRTLGTRVSELLTGAHLLLVLVSLLAGSATAEALLFSANPQHPTNVLTFLLATLVWPFAFLSVSLLWVGLRGRIGGSVLLAELYGALVAGLARVGQRASEDNWSVAQEWRSIRRQHHRYRDVEFATFASASQWYALCFHLAAAFSLVRSALFSDLTFAWSTTAQALEWDALATFFSVVTAPWCQTTGLACVPSELVRATEFVRFTGEYAEPNGAAISGAWWSPLFATLLTYGVLPRLLVATFFSRRVKRRDAVLGESHIELRRRLLRGVTVTKQRAGDVPDGASPAPSVPSVAWGPPPAGAPCWVVNWRGAEGIAERAVRSATELGYHVQHREAAGGTAFEHDEALLLRLAASSQDPVLLVVEGWEAPDKATRRFIQGVRESGSPNRPIYVLVADKPGADQHGALKVWKDRLALLEDPFLSVQSLDSPSHDKPSRNEHRV